MTRKRQKIHMEIVKLLMFKKNLLSNFSVMCKLTTFLKG